jgi:hypothetical protein
MRSWRRGVSQGNGSERRRARVYSRRSHKWTPPTAEQQQEARKAKARLAKLYDEIAGEVTPPPRRVAIPDKGFEPATIRGRNNNGYLLGLRYFLRTAIACLNQYVLYSKGSINVLFLG